MAFNLSSILTNAYNLSALNFARKPIVYLYGRSNIRDESTGRITNRLELAISLDGLIVPVSKTESSIDTQKIFNMNIYILKTELDRATQTLQPNESLLLPNIDDYILVRSPNARSITDATDEATFNISENISQDVRSLITGERFYKIVSIPTLDPTETVVGLRCIAIDPNHASIITADRMRFINTNDNIWAAKIFGGS